MQAGRHLGIGGLHLLRGSLGGLHPHLGSLGGLHPHLGSLGGLHPHLGSLGGLHPHLVALRSAAQGTDAGRAVALALAGAVVGFLVGLAGAAGGALLTPVLVLGFGLPGLAAVGIDLLTSLLVKPIGGAVHLRRRTARLDIAGWLALGSVPAATGGVALARALATPADPWLRPAIGAALLLSAAASLRRRRSGPEGPGDATWPGARRAAATRPAATVLLGAAGGLLVGLTSVGSGSLVLAGLVLLYPDLTAAELVGTDLVQAVPLVAAAAVAHLVAGDVVLPVAAALSAGAVPGVTLGACVSSGARSRAVRPLVALLMVATGLLMVS